MKGGQFKNTTQIKRSQSQAMKPRNRAPTPRDIERQIWKQAGMYDQMPRERKTPTDLERALTALHLPPEFAKTLSKREQQQLEADLSSIGILPGRTAGTLPERLTAAWLMGHGYHYGGMSYGFNPSADWGFQIPLEGGRSGSGGAVADVFVTARASGTRAGLVIRVNGSYWHLKAMAAGHDALQKARLESKGFTVDDLWDTTALNAGSLDQHMTQLLGSQVRL